MPATAGVGFTTTSGVPGVAILGVLSGRLVK